MADILYRYKKRVYFNITNIWKQAYGQPFRAGKSSAEFETVWKTL